MNTRLVAAIAVGAIVAGCTDDHRPAPAAVTAPAAPELTALTLPADAPSVCVASVRQRDALRARLNGAAARSMSADATAKAKKDEAAISMVITDVCP